MNQVGLTSLEAQEKLKQFGPNEIAPSLILKRYEEFKKILLDPMGIMLLGLSALHFLLGNLKDGYILLIAYLPVVSVDVLLELRAQRALQKMKSRLATTAKVMRDGIVKEVSTLEIVAGDVLLFEEGQTIPADGEVIEESHLTVNEAALTGESAPVIKDIGHSFFTGTSVLQGRGLGRVRSTGRHTRYGQIANLLEEAIANQSPLQVKVASFIKKFFLLALILVVILFLLSLWRGAGLVESLIVALTFGISAVPEEFPIVFTLYLSLGAWRLTKHGVIIRSLPSLEALGNVDVICTDKTGTLTEGKFEMENIVPVGNRFDEKKLWQAALMACEVDAIDAMETAIKRKGQPFLKEITDWQMTQDYPFDIKGKYMSHLWSSIREGYRKIAMKGAVEGVLQHCQISEEERHSILAKAETFANEGYRVLGLATREGDFTGLRVADETDLDFIAFLLFSDPVRESAKEAIETCQNSGIEVKMITGDHPLTAHAVAEKVGIRHSNERIFTGNSIEILPEDKKNIAYQEGVIFSRVSPEQKYEMVNALRSMGKVVAMTGDGINDAPALKLADIGISMGMGATDVARSSASMILVKNDFRGLVEAIFEGQKIFSNLRRSFSYLISFHVPIILLALMPPLFGLGHLLLPIHIILLELLVHPISAFAFENLPVKKVRKGKTFLSKKKILESAFAGLIVSAISLAVFWSLLKNNEEAVARSYGIAVFYIGNIFFVAKESDFLLNTRLIITQLALIFIALLIFLLSPVADFLYLKFV